MEPTSSRGVRLHPIEIELLCTFAEVEAPFPLEIESSGQTYAEQLMIYRGAREALTERGRARPPAGTGAGRAAAGRAVDPPPRRPGAPALGARGVRGRSAGRGRGLR